MRWRINALMMALCCLAASAETYNYLTVKIGGRVVSFPLEEVENVTFTVDDLTTPDDNAPNADYELKILTFEDADYRGSGNYLGHKDWSSLIDSPQYGGPLLYGNYSGTTYRWYDQNNTELCAAIDPDDDGLVYWNGGEAISNYTNDSYASETLDNYVQLATPSGGYDGSANFCVHNGYFDGVFYGEPSGGLWFADGQARVIDHMFVSLTSYALSIGMRGNLFCSPASETDWVKLVAIGTDINGAKHQSELVVCMDGVFNEAWQKWDLSVLGEIVRLDFNVTSSMMGEFGLNFPAYFAYDNVAVRFQKK